MVHWQHSTTVNKHVSEAANIVELCILRVTPKNKRIKAMLLMELTKCKECSNIHCAKRTLVRWSRLIFILSMGMFIFHS